MAASTQHVLVLLLLCFFQSVSMTVSLCGLEHSAAPAIRLRETAASILALEKKRCFKFPRDGQGEYGEDKAVALMRMERVLVKLGTVVECCIAKALEVLHQLRWWR
ncbi:hypothetical protein J5N97_006157 [Dioscorea zingiberensis]|uniref:Uncharacterized protein n=1 Tax=Dioscorea zingiberensis TaxID=325984 RepID=A0A9D5D9I8_9LILI|nr:hypothetical protein J5N97_006157 [Dioscorea zingiberensis]